MAKNAAKATGFLVLALLCGTRGTAAQSADVAQLVVHMTDYQHVPAAELAETEAEVSAVYARAGVQNRVGARMRRNGAGGRPSPCRRHRPRPVHGGPKVPGTPRSGRGLERDEKGLCVLFAD